jgi:hypothetical protein
MSGIGHLAAGFAAKPAAPNIPLWVYLAASETNDLLYFAFTAVGLERKVSMTTSFTEGVRYSSLVSNPWSHGLFMSVVWTALAAVIAQLVWRDRRSSLLIGAVVFSHWILDFLMHSNLPLYLEGSPTVGIGLENTGAGFLFMTIFDLIILVAGLVIYFRTRKRDARG